MGYSRLSQSKACSVQLLLTAALTECYRSKAMTSSSMSCASAVPVSAFCPNYSQQHALGQEVNLDAWNFLILEWEIKRQWKCLRWKIGCCYVCTLLECYLLLTINVTLHNVKCNVGFQGSSCPSSPGCIQHFVTLLCCILGHDKL